LLIDDGLVYGKADNQANIVLNNKEIISLVRRKGFVIVNTEN
jgi:hypothetical protein